MDIEVLKSYLVGLGFAVNQPELNKFDSALKQAAYAVESRTSGIVKDVLKWQGAIIGAFTGISTGIIAMGIDVADADTSYRLFGMRMGMTTEAARKLSLGLKLLGTDLATASWDPETNLNLQKLMQIQGNFDKLRGPDFEGNMRGIRDTVQKFRELELTAINVSMEFISKLYVKAKPFIDEITAKVQGWLNWAGSEEGFKKITDWLAGQGLDVLKNTWEILKSIKDLLKEFGVLFQNVVGILSGDKSLEGTTLSFDKLGKAIHHVTDWAKEFADDLTKIETILLRLANGEIDKALEKLNVKRGAIAGGAAGALGGGAIGLAVAGPPGAVIGAIGGAGVGMVGGAAGGTKTGKGAIEGAIRAAGGVKPPEDRTWPSLLAGSVEFWVAALSGGVAGLIKGPHADIMGPEVPADRGKNAPMADTLAQIDAVAKKYNVDALLARAIADTESKTRQYKDDGTVMESPKHALGMFGLLQGTADGYGLDPRDTAQNIEAGIRYFAEISSWRSKPTTWGRERWIKRSPGTDNSRWRRRTIWRASKARFPPQPLPITAAMSTSRFPRIIARGHDCDCETGHRGLLRGPKQTAPANGFAVRLLISHA